MPGRSPSSFRSRSLSCSSTGIWTVKGKMRNRRQMPSSVPLIAGLWLPRITMRCDGLKSKNSWSGAGGGEAEVTALDGDRVTLEVEGLGALENTIQLVHE